MPDFAVEFFGVRGSHPAMGPQFTQFGGHTASVCIHVAGRRVLIDAGLGLIPLGRKIAAEREHVLFLTHLHYDHLYGLPFFAPLYRPGNRVRVFTPAPMLEALKVFWGPPYFPVGPSEVGAQVQIMPTPEGSVDLSELFGLADRTGEPTLHTLFLGGDIHPQDGVMLHRVTYGGKNIVYATDVELSSEEAVQTVAGFCQGADVLVCDTQYTNVDYPNHKGFGHNSMAMTRRLTELTRPKQLVLFHHAPNRDDSAVKAMEAEMQSLFPGTIAAYEGLIVSA